MNTPLLYAINAQGDLTWYRHLGREDGSFRWDNPAKVGTGWDKFEHVFSGGGGIIYAIEPASPAAPFHGRPSASGGRLLWYRHLGRDDGSVEWDGPHAVGTGWSGFERVFSGGNGVIYAVKPHVDAVIHANGESTPASGGDLMWYRHLGRENGSGSWEGPRKVGTGWSGFEHVFSAENGIIYGVEPHVEAFARLKGRQTPASGGKLQWYRHLGREDGSVRWEGPKAVGTSWSGFEHMCSGDNGVIYIVEPIVEAQAHITGRPTPASGGNLRWYRHVGREDGSAKWEGPQKVGTGWAGLKTFFSDREQVANAVATGRFCDFLDPPGTPQIGVKSYLVKESRRAMPLTWSLSGTVNGVSAADMLATINAAFALWKTAVPALDFNNVTTAGANIVIGVGDLGAPNPANGRVTLGSTLPDGSAITLNNDPSVFFVPRLPGGNSLLSVAAHEIGHALGILHSTTPGTLMFPSSSSAETLAIEDIAAVRALYGWAPQRPVPDIGTQASPALCVCGPWLVMAWRGIGDDDGIWTARTTDGINWTPQRAVPGTGTTDGPTLAWDGAILWLAIRGVAGDDALYWATSGDFGDNWSAVQQITGTGSALAPSLTVADGVPLLVWRGVPGDDGLYYTRWQNPWAAQQKIGGAGSEDRPSVCVGFDNLPRMAWRGVAGDDSLYTSTLIERFWQPQQQLSWVIAGNGPEGTVGIGVPGSSVGPTITNGGGTVFLAWQGVPGDDRIYFTQAAAGPGGSPPIEWSSQAVVEGIGTSHRPAIVMFMGLPFMAWKGVGNDHGIYTTRQVVS